MTAAADSSKNMKFIDMVARILASGSGTPFCLCRSSMTLGLARMPPMMRKPQITARGMVRRSLVSRSMGRERNFAA